MGYTIEQLDSKFYMKEESKADALRALKVLFADDKDRDWIHAHDILNSHCLERAMAICRWELEEDGSGNCIGINFTGDRLGDDEDILRAVAPYVENGSYIKMLGEDGETWTWIFRNKELQESKDADQSSCITREDLIRCMSDAFIEGLHYCMKEQYGKKTADEMNTDAAHIITKILKEKGFCK